MSTLLALALRLTVPALKLRLAGCQRRKPAMDRLRARVRLLPGRPTRLGRSPSAAQLRECRPLAVAKRAGQPQARHGP
ncbi:MAG: hypothetical protein ACRDTN_05475, partial [Mycobacterium sp.]